MRFAVCNVGGGFAFVGAMQDSFPHALELSKKGYNAFAVIYRPGAQTACEDLSRVIAFIFENAEELEVGTYGTRAFGKKNLPKTAAVIMQYTGLSEVTGAEPATYACVGTSDWIADYRTMQARISAIKANRTDTEIQVFKGLPHGFGLGKGTVAEGWINEAVKFWERQM